MFYTYLWYLLIFFTQTTWALSRAFDRSSPQHWVVRAKPELTHQLHLSRLRHRSLILSCGLRPIENFETLLLPSTATKLKHTHYGSVCVASSLRTIFLLDTAAAKHEHERLDRIVSRVTRQTWLVSSEYIYMDMDQLE